MEPSKREAKVKALAVLEKALQPTTGRAAPESVQKMLRTAAPRDVQELLAHLDQRGQEIAAEARAKLEKRGADEARDMRGILESQKKRIAEQKSKRKVARDW